MSPRLFSQCSSGLPVLPTTEAESIIATVPTTPMDPQRSIIRQLMDGSDVEENFRRLFQSYYQAVFNLFARKGFSPDECRDLTQEVFLAVYEGIENLRSESAFLSWLFATARNIGFRYLDRKRRSVGMTPPTSDPEESAMDSAPAHEPDPLDRLLDLERAAVLREAIEELPVRVQDCLRGRLVDDLSYREIGERLGISENTVAVHVHRGLKNLKARLKLIFEAPPSVGGV
jgi:RNA polymerase sigma-70 factor (ECF subfamily)